MISLENVLNGWVVKKITEETEFITDYVANGSFASLSENVKYLKDDGYAILLRVTDYSKNFKGPFVFIDKHAFNFLKKSSINKGDIIIGNVGSIGVSFEAPVLSKPMSIAPNALLIRPKNNTRFLYFLLLSPGFQNHLALISSKSAQPKFNKSQFRGIDIAVPSLPEQYKITYVLSTVQKAIDQQDKLINTINKIKTTLMQQLFTEGTKGESQKQTEIGLVPESWEVIELGKVCKFTRGPFGGSLKKEIFVKEGFAVYEQSHAIHGDLGTFRYFIDQEKLNEMVRFEVKEGDLIMSCSGTFGKVQIVPSEFKRGIINQALLLLRPTRMNGQFLKLMIESPFFQNQLKSNILGVAIQNVASVSVLKKLHALLPSIDEQNRVISNVQLIQSKLENYIRKKKTLTDLFKTLLNELMTGQRRVHKIDFDLLNTEYHFKEQPISMAAET